MSKTSVPPISSVRSSSSNSVTPFFVKVTSSARVVSPSGAAITSQGESPLSSIGDHWDLLRGSGANGAPFCDLSTGRLLVAAR